MRGFGADDTSSGRAEDQPDRGGIVDGPHGSGLVARQLVENRETVGTQCPEAAHQIVLGGLAVPVTRVPAPVDLFPIVVGSELRSGVDRSTSGKGCFFEMVAHDMSRRARIRGAQRFIRLPFLRVTFVHERPCSQSVS